MTPAHIALVQRSFSRVVRHPDETAALFYRRLFEIDPSRKALFKGDMKRQGKMLMATLGTIVDQLQSESGVQPALEALARRHIGYGVQVQDFTAVGTSLLWAIEAMLGRDFTVETRKAWMAAYALVASIMREAMRRANADGA